MKRMMPSLSLLCLTLTLTLPLSARAADADELEGEDPAALEADESGDAALEAEINSDELTREQWNQWICQAYAPGSLRPYNGRSFFFRAGSGEGQQAKRQAHREAIAKCEFRTGRNCRSNFDKDCRVRRLERP